LELSIVGLRRVLGL